eukprot:TRINITY_DN357_c0_g1_i1.p1 TRINITY_DN357_c0_g1~~TRINITY_DN357_c0_g1_i1.p1  ORF type:complete len:485 (+),score=53.40 TRINITY_DN357_c0_g1_i1:1072-2526(+)
MIMFFADIRKAFDLVNWALLLKKMQQEGCPAYQVRWIARWLQQRSYSVRVNNQLSTSFGVNCGIPQGSPLSPILFKIFFRDVPGDLVYMDDIAFVAHSHQMIQMKLQRLETWATANFVTFATEKCAILLPQYSSEQDHELYLNNQKIASVDHYKYLGVTLDPPKSDSPLRLQTHLLKELPKLRNLVKKLRIPGASTAACRSIYLGIVRARMSYALAVKDQCLKPYQVIQNSAFRTILGAHKTAPAEPLHVLMNLPSISQLHESCFEKLTATALFSDWDLRCECQHSCIYQKIRPKQDVCFQPDELPSDSHCEISHQLAQSFTSSGSVPVTEDDSLDGFCDGGFSQTFGTIGGVILDNEKLVLDFCQKFCNVHSSYRAERLAMIRKRVRILTDSLGLCQKLTGVYHSRSLEDFETLQILRLVDKIQRSHNVVIKGHSGIPGNEMADKKTEEAWILPPQQPLDAKYVWRQRAKKICHVDKSEFPGC